jgi:glycosyltransferase involved in cell wall biosynthesis
MQSVRPLPAPRVELVPAAPAVEVVVPVYNEQRVLAESIRRLHDYLSEALAVSWRIVIADNGSTDATQRVAMALADDLPNVKLLALTQKGRGRALRAAWERSDAEVVCYMDVDLSTDLRALPPLLAPLFSGHSDVAIGSRLASGSRVVRGARRELISRGYNALLRTVLGARFSDAQCGFKAIRTDAARRLLPAVRDDGWFFDTELLVLAQRAGMRIHEVPVDWVEDHDSRVDVVSTALGDLRGIGRLLSETRLTRFMAIGAISTIAYALLYLLLRGPLGPQGANALALGLTAVANTHANRHLTFRIRARDWLVRQHLAGALVYVLTLGLTSGALAVLRGIASSPARAVELTVLVAAGVCATVTRYMALRSWVFAPRTHLITERENPWPPRPSHYPAL